MNRTTSAAMDICGVLIWSLAKRIGVPKEVKEHEYRVGLIPESVREFVAAGHELSVETGAGAGIDAADQAYLAASATIVDTAAEIFAKSEMIVLKRNPRPHEPAEDARTG